MSDKGKIGAALVVFVVLMTFPIWHNLVNGEKGAQPRWRKLNGAHLLPLVRAGVEFEHGRPVERNDDDQKEAA